MPSFPAPSRLVIASRESRLALWQAEHVKALLEGLYPACEVVIDAMTTRGDQILDRTLSKVGGKGLFVKELEHALQEGRCDLAVHSLKDVPMVLAPCFQLVAMLEREDARDAWVSSVAESLEHLPHGATVGTSSLRREAQLRARRPDLTIAPLRGNLDTRLAKLDRGDFQAIVLAAAGLTRLGLATRIRSLIEVDTSLPAPGQGTLGIEIMAERQDLAAWLAPLNHAASAAAARSERQVSRMLGGSCEVPLAAYTTVHGEALYCRALVASHDGLRIVRAEQRGSIDAPEALGSAVAEQMLAQGVKELVGV